MQSRMNDPKWFLNAHAQDQEVEVFCEVSCVLTDAKDQEVEKPHSLFPALQNATRLPNLNFVS